MDNITGRIIGAFNKISLFQIITILLVIGSITQTNMNRSKDVEYQQFLLNRIDTLKIEVDKANLQIDSLNMMHPWREKKAYKNGKARTSCSSTILGKLMWGGYSTNLHTSLVTALEAYTGPKVCVNSTVRHK